jgi:hypothetical protein
MKTKAKFKLVSRVGQHELYEFRVEIGNRYVIPGGKNGRYSGSQYNKKSLPEVIKEIEGEYPRYKGKVKAFRVILEEV